MADQKQLELLKQGVEVWNTWREENPAVKIDLSDEDPKGFLRWRSLCQAGESWMS